MKFVFKTDSMIDYRASESQNFREHDVLNRLQEVLANNPGLYEQAREAWRTAEATLIDHFRATAAKLGRKHPDAPKVFEVHHAIETMRESFLLQLAQNRDPAVSAEFALQRIGVTMKVEEFLAMVAAHEAEDLRERDPAAGL